VSILEPINSVSSLLLHEKRGNCLSLFWYVIDWLVCVYDQTLSWKVYSVNDSVSISVPTSSLSQSILSFQSGFSRMLKDLYLTDSFKSRHPKQYELLCLVTLLDPRTKDFGFFHSSPSLDFPRLCHRDARLFLMNELRNEICSLLELFFDDGLQHNHGDGDGSRSSLDDEGCDEYHVTDAVYARLEELVVASGLSHISKKSASPSGSTKSNDVRSFGNSGEFFQSSYFEGLSLEPSEKAVLRKCIDDYCRSELQRYEKEPIICPSHQIRHHAQDPLQSWSTTSKKYPMISRVARRFMSIQMVSLIAPEVKDLTYRIYSKPRQPMCPILFEAVVFLHFNGILDHQPTDWSGACADPPSHLSPRK
jgi:hypothetical protein